jgi:hypothetical protein
MKKIKLSLLEVYGLNVELKGFTNPSTGEKLEKGLLDEKLPIIIKYKLSDLSDKIDMEIIKINKFKEDLIKTLGTVDENGNIGINFKINETYKEDGSLDKWDVNPAYNEYQKQFNELLQQEVEFDFNELIVEDFNIETEVYPKILFKIINQ